MPHSVGRWLDLQLQIFQFSCQVEAASKNRTVKVEDWEGTKYRVTREGGAIVDRQRITPLPTTLPQVDQIALPAQRAIDDVVRPVANFFIGKEPSVLKGLPGELLWDGLERFGRLSQLDPSEVQQIGDLVKPLEKGGIPGQVLRGLLGLGLITADYLLHIVAAIPIVAAREARKAVEIATFNPDQRLKELQPKLEKLGTLQPLNKPLYGSNLGNVLAENGIGLDDIQEVSDRLSDMSPVKTSHEAINRRQSLMQFFERLDELERLADASLDDKTHGGETEGQRRDRQRDIQCRILALKAEINNGELLDEFLRGDRNQTANRWFVDQIARREPITGKPRTQSTSINVNRLSRGVEKKLQQRLEPPIMIPGIPKTDPETRDQYQQAVADLKKLLPIPLDVNVGIVAPNLGPFALQAPSPVDSESTYAEQMATVYDGTGLQPRDGLINLGQWNLDPNTVMIHESGHIFEAKAGLTSLTAAYVRARSVDRRASLVNYKKGVDAPTYDLRQKFQDSGANVRDTDLSVPYSGKVYTNAKGEQTNSEIISVGLETLETPEALQSIAVNDREHLMFTLGCLDSSTVESSREELRRQYGWAPRDKNEPR